MKIKNFQFTKKNFDNFMTEKEKNYVSNIFRKKVNFYNKIYNYEMFYKHTNGNQNQDSLENEIAKSKENMKNLEIKKNRDNTKEVKNENKENLKETKEFDCTNKSKLKKISFIKSLKLPRLMLDNSVPIVDDLAIKLKIEKMIDEQICEKYKIRESCLVQILNENKNEIHKFFKVNKFRKLLKDIFESDANEIKKIILINLITKSEFICDSGRVSEFFDYLVSFMPELTKMEIIESNFMNNFFKNLPGILLATLILINQENFSDLFFDVLKKNKTEILFQNQLKFVWRFLAVLYINITEEKRKFLHNALKNKIIEINNSNNQNLINDMGPFIEALGLDD